MPLVEKGQGQGVGQGSLCRTTSCIEDPQVEFNLISGQFGKLFIKFLDSLDFKASQRLGLRFYFTKSLILFCSLRHIYSKTAMRLFLA